MGAHSRNHREGWFERPCLRFFLKILLKSGSVLLMLSCLECLGMVLICVCANGRYKDQLLSLAI